MRQLVLVIYETLLERGNRHCVNLELAKKIRQRDPKGIKQMWDKIKKKLYGGTFNVLTKKDMMDLSKDKIRKISERTQHRLKEFRDLVNPTVR